MKLLLVAYDVTGLTDAEVAQVEFEAVVQAERSKGDGFEDSSGHPSVRVDSEVVEWGDVSDVKSKSLAGVIDLFARLRRAAAA